MNMYLKSLLVLLVGVLGVQCEIMDSPKLREDYWWGPGNSSYADTTIRPFRVQFKREMIKDLRYRLKNHRPFVPPLEGVGFTYGFNSDYIESYLQYWAKDYNFKEREEFFNQYNHYITDIQGIPIHFIHVKQNEVPEGVEVVPILLLHGWPGSVREFYEAIPHLSAISKERDYVLELVIPSLPGFGFSGSAVKPGLGVVEMGVVFRNLMQRLGYNKYYIQGGDWGGVICSSLATLYPKEVLGYHTNFAVSILTETLLAWVMGSNNPDLVVDPSVADRMYPISNVLKYYMQEFGYFHIQAAKPDTVGIALSDTPAGLLAWIIQMMGSVSRFSNVYTEDGGILQQIPMQSLIDNLMLYWSTNSITTSARIYAETFNLETYNLGVLQMPTPVLTSTVHASFETVYQSPLLLKFKYPNLVRSKILDIGGHFLALEMSEVFSKDVLESITLFRKIHAEDCK